MCDNILIEKYPFLYIEEDPTRPWKENEGAWLDNLPPAWVNAFAEQMCSELCDALGKYVNDFIIFDLKEKYAEMRLYWHWKNREYTDQDVEEMRNVAHNVHKVIEKYSRISYHTCVMCGQPATCYSKGWILPYCSECFSKKFQ